MIANDVEQPLLVTEDNEMYVHSQSSYADDQVFTINHGDTFAVFDRWGDIEQIGKAVQGIYHNGTRYISCNRLRINGRRPLLLSSTTKSSNELLSVDLTNPGIKRDDDYLVQGSIHISRQKFVRNSVCYERMFVKNFQMEKFRCCLSISILADFKDIFEVRGYKREQRGERLIPEVVNGMRIRLAYQGVDGRQRVSDVVFTTPPTSLTTKEASFNIELEGGEELEICYHIRLSVDESAERPSGFSQAFELIDPEIISTRNMFATISTSHQQVNQWFNRSSSDLISLLAPLSTGLYPFAGVPWYNAPFGRDGILTAFEVLAVAPRIARDVLAFLASTQSDRFDDTSDAEPGKIVHEIRSGEMVESGEIPFKRYYGTVDATPLFIALAAAYFKRTGDYEFIASIWENICRALVWIEQHGDLDGDGFIEYQSRSPRGLVNLGWKDSDDSISDELGNLATAPIALVEVQGYVYMALAGAAYLANAFGKKDQATKFSLDAAILKQRFHESFWDEELSCYVLALAADKRPCRVVSSNAGHTLFSGIADPSVAKRLLDTLFSPRMDCGWGIRTLSASAKRFNPISYHNGSVWPHDNAVIALGAAKYGYTDRSLQIFEAFFDAATYCRLFRLPELFCGFSRRNGEGPTEYPVACSPQAWASGSAFGLLEAILGIEIDAPTKKVVFSQTTLPAYVQQMEVTNFLIGDSYASFTLHRYTRDIAISVEQKPSGWSFQVVK